MAEYIHGAYGQVKAVGVKAAAKGPAFVYFGTAPINTVEGGAKNVNIPIVIRDFSDMKNKLGYSDDWAKYTLCEAAKVHLSQKGVGPLIFINVLDTVKHKASAAGSISMAPVNGIITVAGAEDIILDSVVIKTKDEEPVTKVKGRDYVISYSPDTKAITIREIVPGGMGTAELAITYNSVDPTLVTNADVIGFTDGIGMNTGIYAVKNVYQLTGYIPSYMAAPGFSADKAVHDVLIENSMKINKHWDAIVFADIPIVSNGTPVTLDTAYTWKQTNNYNHENEKVYFPLIKGTDGVIYHLSVLAAANRQELLIEQDGIPYKTESNTACPIIENLYMGEAYTGRIFDDSIINDKLNQNGITSACYVGGRWAIWGPSAADYDQNTADSVNVFDTARGMLYYISNDFQARRSIDVDKPMTANALKQIVSEEQARLDALVGIGALTYGEVVLNVSLDAQSDMINGDFVFLFNVTTTPLAKSLTAKVTWTADGFVTYFEALME